MPGPGPRAEPVPGSPKPTSARPPKYRSLCGLIEPRALPGARRRETRGAGLLRGGSVGDKAKGERRGPRNHPERPAPSRGHGATGSRPAACGEQGRSQREGPPPEERVAQAHGACEATVAQGPPRRRRTREGRSRYAGHGLHSSSAAPQAALCPLRPSVQLPLLRLHVVEEPPHRSPRRAGWWPAAASEPGISSPGSGLAETRPARAHICPKEPAQQRAKPRGGRRGVRRPPRCELLLRAGRVTTLRERPGLGGERGASPVERGRSGRFRAP